MNHYAAPDFWECYHLLPSTARQAADKAFALLKADPRHPSLHFKKGGEFWSARAGLHHRAVGRQLRSSFNTEVRAASLLGQAERWVESTPTHRSSARAMEPGSVSFALSGLESCSTVTQGSAFGSTLGYHPPPLRGLETIHPARKSSHTKTNLCGCNTRPTAGLRKNRRSGKAPALCYGLPRGYRGCCPSMFLPARGPYR